MHGCLSQELAQDVFHFNPERKKKVGNATKPLNADPFSKMSVSCIVYTVMTSSHCPPGMSPSIFFLTLCNFKIVFN